MCRFAESRRVVKAGNRHLEENHSGTAFLNRVRNAGPATLLGLGLIEPKSGIIMQIRW